MPEADNTGRITRDQCREFAKSCREMAAQSEYKKALLDMAETWDKLAAIKGDDRGF
jgi:hypothetical protein